jgi:hypothetical protein
VVWAENGICWYFGPTLSGWYPELTHHLKIMFLQKPVLFYIWCQFTHLIYLHHD